MKFEKSVLITGASKGIGRGIALDAASKGYNTIIHYGRDECGAKQTLSEIQVNGGTGRLISFDITDREMCKAVLTYDINTNGAYYGVVLNAGIARDNAFPALEDDDWDFVMQTNLNGFYNILKPIIMPMIHRRQPGRIIALSSVSGVMGNRGQVNYSASKAGIIGAVKALAIELAKRNITVNAVAPGVIDTAMIHELALDEVKKIIPMQRVGTINEVAAVTSFLLSEEASYITRQVINVNGGMF